MIMKMMSYSSTWKLFENRFFYSFPQRQLAWGVNGEET
jgi:hypothetical protein